MVLLEDRAHITRIGELTLPAGQKTTLLDKQSVLLSRVEGAGQVLDLLFQEIPVDVSWGKMISNDEIQAIDEFEESVETSGLQLVDVEKELEDITLDIDDLATLAEYR